MYKGMHPRFPKKGNLRLAKIYNALLRNHIEPKIEKILKKNQNGFRRNRSMTGKIWLSVDFKKMHAQKYL